MSAHDGLVIGTITDADIDLMQRRIGWTNPTLRKGWLTAPYNATCSPDAVRRWAVMIGDDNPLYLHLDPGYAANSRWGGVRRAAGI